VTDSSLPAQTATQAFSVTIVLLPPVAPISPALISASPTSLSFGALPGALTGSQALTLTSSNAIATPFTASVAVGSGPRWLGVSPASGWLTSQTTLNIGFDASGLGQGTYTGNVTVGTAQTSVTVPITLRVISRITVSPQSLSFTYRVGEPGAPAPQIISVFSMPQGASYSASAVGGESWLVVPPVLSATPPGSIPVSIVTAPLTPGNFSAQVTIVPEFGDPISVPVMLTVQPVSSPKLWTSILNPRFALTQGSAATGRQITVFNTGGGTLKFTAQAASDDGSWLSVTGDSSGNTATSSAPGVIAYTVDPGGLSPGIYTGAITVKDPESSDQSIVIVTMAVSQTAQSVVLSQNGITLNTVAGSTEPASQSFAVLNAGGGVMNWTTTATTISGDWLSVSPESGNSVGGQAGSNVTNSVKPDGLAAGQYYGAVTITAPNAVNSPQSVSVLLNVPAAGTGSEVALSSGAVILSGAAGSRTAASRQITISNPGVANVNFTASTITSGRGSWLSVNQSSGMLAPGSTPLTVQGDLSNLAAGVQTGTVRLALDDGTVDWITVVMIATGGIAASTTAAPLAPSLFRPEASSACVGGKAGYLVTTIASPLDQSVVQAGMGQTLRLLLVDDCGNPVSAGAGVQVSFSNNDLAIDLQDAGSGVWEGTWLPTNQSLYVSLNATARAGAAFGELRTATSSLTVSLAGPSTSAAAQSIGVVNAASAAQGAPQIVTPGAYVAIYGMRLAGTGMPAATTAPCQHRSTTQRCCWVTSPCRCLMQVRGR
jgi:hypothetical protein